MQLDLTKALVNKPLTANIGGRKREIGRIMSAEYVFGRGITIEAEVTDEDLAGQLNAKVLEENA